MNMKRLLAIVFAALCASAHAQTGITVMADTNRVIRTNFLLLRSQVSDLSGASFAISNITGLQTALDGKLATNGTLAISNITSLQSSLDGKLATNGNGASLTNITAENITGTVALASNVTQTIAISNGGTGATTVSNARINLLPSYTGNSNRILALNSNATDLIWTTNAAGGGGIVNLADTTNGVTNTLGIANGGTGSTTANGALTNLGIFTASAVVIGGTNSAGANVIIGADSVGRGGSGLGGVAVGRNANNTNSGIAIGYAAYADGKGVGGTAIGYQATNISDGGAAIGYQATATNGFAGGRQAKALGADNVQLGTGNNTNNNTIQFLSAGAVDTNEWARLANSTTFGGYIMAAPTNGTNGQILALNSNATAVVWTTNAGGSSSTVDLSTTNATGILPVSKGGSGATTAQGALTNFGVFPGSSGLFVTTMTSSYPDFATIIGVEATNASGGDGNVVVGYQATGSTDGSDLGGVAVGRSAYTSGDGVAVGNQSRASAGTAVAIGVRAVATNGVQIGTGTNTTTNTIQFRSAGLVDTNEWSALANSSQVGRQVLTNDPTSTNKVLFYRNVTDGIAWYDKDDFLKGIGVYGGSSTNNIIIGPSAFVDSTNTQSIAFGSSAGILNSSGASVAIGRLSSVDDSAGSIAIGLEASVGGTSSPRNYNVAIGYASAVNDVSYAVQLGRGTNVTGSTIQFLSAGSVSTNEWSYLANVSSRGAYAMTNTAGISTNITFVDNNTNTNSVTISNGIITGWTQ